MLREWVKHRYGVFDETGFESDRQYPLWTSEYGSHPPPSSFSSSKLAASYHLQENSCTTTTTFANNTTRYLYMTFLRVLNPLKKIYIFFFVPPGGWGGTSPPLKESQYNMLCVCVFLPDGRKN